jgi:hypothetical protein
LILGFVLFSLLGAAVAVAALAAWGRTDRSRKGSFSSGALSFLGSASLSSFILIAAFLIAGSWSNLNTARGHTWDEARAVNTAFADADPAIRPLLRSYLTSVIGSEWRSMAEGRADPAAWHTLDTTRAHVQALPDSPARAQELTDLVTVYTTRQIRLADTAATLPAPLYPALIGTGLLVVLYAPIAGLTFGPRESTILGLVGATVAFGVFMVLHMTHPYTGPIHVTPAAYLESLQRFAQLAPTAR